MQRVQFFALLSTLLTLSLVVSAQNDTQKCRIFGPVDFVSDDLSEQPGGPWTEQSTSVDGEWSVVDTDSLFGNHSAFGPSIIGPALLDLISPTIPANEGTKVTFYLLLHTESLPGDDTCFDGLLLEVAVVGEDPEELPVGAVDPPYDFPIDSEYQSPKANSLAWCITAAENWTRVEVDLSSFAGNDVQIYWRMASDEDFAVGGAWIDRVEVFEEFPEDLLSCPDQKNITTDGNGEVAVPDFTEEVVIDFNCLDSNYTITQDPTPGTILEPGSYNLTISIFLQDGSGSNCRTSLVVIEGDVTPTGESSEPSVETDTETMDESVGCTVKPYLLLLVFMVIIATVMAVDHLD